MTSEGIDEGAAAHKSPAHAASPNADRPDGALVARAPARQSARARRRGAGLAEASELHRERAIVAVARDGGAPGEFAGRAVARAERAPARRRLCAEPTATGRSTIPALEHARAGVERLLTLQEPFPALALDRAWNVVAANAAVAILLAGVDPELLKPPQNAIRLSLHPRGLAPLIVNFGEWRAHLIERLRRQLRLAGDARSPR